MIFLINHVTFFNRNILVAVFRKDWNRTRAEVERSFQSMRKAIVKIHTRNDGNLNQRNSGGDDKQLLNLE